MSQVVIDDITPRTQLISAAGQTVFNTNWTADVATDVDVYARLPSADANDVTQIISPNDYNVTFIGASQTVRVTFLVGRTINEIITIVRATPADRMNLYTNTNFVPSMLNQDFGILTLVDQQNKMYDYSTSVRYNVSETIEQPSIIGLGDLVVPKLLPLQTWRMNSTGTQIEAITVPQTPASTDNPYVVWRDTPELTQSFNLGGLTSGILAQTVLAGSATPFIAVNGVDYWAPGDVIILPGLPTNPNDAASKAYVDAIATSGEFKDSCVAATTGALTATYDNGVSGVGATLTNSGAQAALSVDGVAMQVNARLLVKNQGTTFQNGIYVVTDIGSVATNWVLTRSTDFDVPGEMTVGCVVPIDFGGTANGATSWLLTSNVTTVGTDAVVFIQFTASLPLSPANGGTGLNNGANTLTIDANSEINQDVRTTGSPTFVDLTLTGANILDVNGNVMLNLTGVPTGGNYLRISPNASGSAPFIQATSSVDANVDFYALTLGTGIFRMDSGNATPLQIRSGTSSQHTTNFAFANTNQTRTVTFQDASGTLAYLTDIPSVPTQAIKQVVTAQINTAISTTSTSYVDATGFSVTITPTSASSRIMIIAQVNAIQGIVAATNPLCYMNILRGASLITITDTIRIGASSSAGGIGAQAGWGYTTVDSPATTSPTTYKIQWRVSNASCTLSMAGNITVLEII